MTKPDHIKLKALLVILATFTLGTVTGAALNGMYVQAGSAANEWRGRSAAPVLDSLRRELKLTDEQIAAIRKVTEATRRELRAVQFDRCPGLANARQSLIGRVRPLLTPAQQHRFDIVISERQRPVDFPARDER